MFSFFLFLFYKQNLGFLKSNPYIESLFLCCSVLEFSSFLIFDFFSSVDVVFVAQSLASGTVEEREADVRLLLHFWKKTNYSGDLWV